MGFSVEIESTLCNLNPREDLVPLDLVYMGHPKIEAQLFNSLFKPADVSAKSPSHDAFIIEASTLVLSLGKTPDLCVKYILPKNPIENNEDGRTPGPR